MSARVRLEGVARVHQGARGETLALTDVSFETQPGEFLTIVGPSGCGKSTILNLVAGLDKPTRGQVLVDGQPVTKPGADRILVFQEHALFPWLDAKENVEFGLRVAGVKPDERSALADEALRMVHLESFAKARVHELSGGMKQRVAIARALVLKPRVLLMDEPFAALDAQTRDSLQASLEEVWRVKKPTVIFVTHNVREAARLGDRVIIMSPRPGRIEKVLENRAPRPRDLDEESTVVLARQIKHALDAQQREAPP